MITEWYFLQYSVNDFRKTMNKNPNRTDNQATMILIQRIDVMISMTPMQFRSSRVNSSCLIRVSPYGLNRHGTFDTKEITIFSLVAHVIKKAADIFVLNFCRVRDHIESLPIPVYLK